jgi:hypothetical protein
LEFFNVPLCGYFEVWRNWISFGRRLQNAGLSLACKCTCYLTGCVKIRSFCEYKSGFVEEIRITNGSNFCVYECALAEIAQSTATKRDYGGSKAAMKFEQGKSNHSKNAKRGNFIIFSPQLCPMIIGQV